MSKIDRDHIVTMRGANGSAFEITVGDLLDRLGRYLDVGDGIALELDDGSTISLERKPSPEYKVKVVGKKPS